VLIGLELRDLLLPIGVEDVAVVAREALIDLGRLAVCTWSRTGIRHCTFCHEPVNNCGSGAWPWAAIWSGCQRLEAGGLGGCAGGSTWAEAPGMRSAGGSGRHAIASDERDESDWLSRRACRRTVVAALGGIVQRVHAISVIATRRSACLAHLLLAVAL